MATAPCGIPRDFNSCYDRSQLQLWILKSFRNPCPADFKLPCFGLLNDHFWAHLAAPHFDFGRPLDVASNAPFTQWNTEKMQSFFIWCVIKCRFDATWDAKLVWTIMVEGPHFENHKFSGIFHGSSAMNRGYVNGGFQTVVRVLSGGHFPPPPFYLDLTPFDLSLPLFNLFFTSF